MSLPSWERGLKPRRADDGALAGRVAPLVGAWIETELEDIQRFGCTVAPLVGAWIETCSAHRQPASRASLPSWERGLKPPSAAIRSQTPVAPLVGAWIETLLMRSCASPPLVAPLVGAWIETPEVRTTDARRAVAPLVGAWIETCLSTPRRTRGFASLPSWERGLKPAAALPVAANTGRSPRGSVD